MVEQDARKKQSVQARRRYLHLECAEQGLRNKNGGRLDYGHSAGVAEPRRAARSSCYRHLVPFAWAPQQTAWHRHAVSLCPHERSDGCQGDLVRTSGEHRTFSVTPDSSSTSSRWRASHSVTSCTTSARDEGCSRLR